MPQLLKFTPLEHWTGGVQGIVLLKPDAPFGLQISSDQWLWIFTVGVSIVMYVCAYQLIKSRTGRAMMAIRDNPIAAKSMGIDLSLYKTLTFGVSALYTGVAGALAAIVIAVRGARQLHLGAGDRACSSAWWSAASASIVGTLIGGLFLSVRAEYCRAFHQGSFRSHVRPDSDRHHLPNAVRCGRAFPPDAAPADYPACFEIAGMKT